MESQISEIIENLDTLTEDLPLKAKNQLQSVIDELNKIDSSEPDGNMLMKIQDDLEVISNMSNIDYFTRNEIINAITSIEAIYNG